MIDCFVDSCFQPPGNTQDGQRHLVRLTQTSLRHSPGGSVLWCHYLASSLPSISAIRCRNRTLEYLTQRPISDSEVSTRVALCGFANAEQARRYSTREPGSMQELSECPDHPNRGCLDPVPKIPARPTSRRCRPRPRLSELVALQHDITAPRATDRTQRRTPISRSLSPMSSGTGARSTPIVHSVRDTKNPTLNNTISAVRHASVILMPGAVTSRSAK